MSQKQVVVRYSDYGEFTDEKDEKVRKIITTDTGSENIIAPMVFPPMYPVLLTDDAIEKLRKVEGVDIEVHDN